MTKTRKFVGLLSLGLGLAAIASTTSAHAASYAVFSDRFNYSGTVSKYASQSDAEARQNPIFTTTIPGFSDGGHSYSGRDLSIYVSNGAPFSIASQNYNDVLNAWWYTTTGPSLGSGNPNNKDVGFFQLYDDDASTLITWSAHWDSTLRHYTLEEQGANAPYSLDYSRLWDGNLIDDGGPSTSGTFVDYSFGLFADFATPATEDGSNPGWYYINGEPVGVTGYLKGVFDNQCSASVNCSTPGVDGWYAFDFTIGMNSWVFDNKDSLPTGPDASLALYNVYPTSYFGAQTPLPGAMLLYVSGLGVLGFASRKKLSGAASKA